MMTTSSKKKIRVTKQKKGSELEIDILIIISFLLSVFTFLSLYSHSSDDPSWGNIIFSTYQDNINNYFGKLGAYVSDMLGTVFGAPSLFIPVLLFYLAILLLRSKAGAVSKFAPGLSLIYGLLIILSSSILFGLLGDTDPFFQLQKAGGLFGVLATQLIVSTVGTVGGVITFFTILLINVMLLFSLSFSDLSKLFILIYTVLKPKIITLYIKINAYVDSKIIEYKNRKKSENDSDIETETIIKNNNIDQEYPSPITTNTQLDNDKQTLDISSTVTDTTPIYLHTDTTEINTSDNLTPNSINSNNYDNNLPPTSAVDTNIPATIDNNNILQSTDSSDDENPLFIDEDLKNNTLDDTNIALTPNTIKTPISPYANYHIPIDILDQPDENIKGDTREELDAKGQLLLQKLSDFGVHGKVRAIYPGPVVTMFEYEPAPGTRISKIATLENDLALNMSALSIRIIAPIPGKNAVGIEVPNKNRASVFIRELFATPEFIDEKSPLTIALGKTAVGKPFMADIAKMPHLLVAGTTGSGKSVGLNTMICSILYKASPDKVKFIMIDPKMVELSIYNGIPHLLAPVVTDPKLASSVLKNVATEMDKRYEILAEKKVRNIESFNQLAAVNPDMKNMYYLVVVVDEFADLMMIASKDVEFSITRIAQKARAVGIHLIIATQRPTANVITGLIKSNMPARIAFKVSQKNDSRVILDQNGADMLLGRGDSLFMPPGTSDLIRIHGAFVSDEDVRNIVEHLKQFGEPEYNMEMVKEVKDPSEEKRSRSDSDNDYDEKYEDALAIVYDKGQASISLIQRHLKIGYNRAARIVDMMEQEGIITPSDGTARPREILKR